MKLYVIDKNGHHEQIEIDKNQKVRFSLVLKNLTNFNQSKNNTSYHTLTVKIPATTNNTAAFKHCNDMDTFNVDEYRGLDMRFRVDAGSLYYSGILKILSITHGKVDTFNVQLLAGFSNFISKLPEKLSDLDLGTALFDQATIESVMDNADPYSKSNKYYYSIKKYNIFQGADYVGINDVKPDIFAKTVIDAMSTQSGMRIKSRFFQTQYFLKKLLLFANDDDQVVPYHARIEASGSNYYTTISPGDPDINPGNENWNVAFDNVHLMDGSYPVGGYTVYAPGSMKVKVTVNMNVTSMPSPAFLDIRRNSLIAPIKTVALVLGDNSFSFNVNVNTEGGLIFRFVNDVTIDVGSFIEVEGVGQLVLDSTYDLGKMLPNITPAEFINGLNDTFNLIWMYDYVHHKLIVEPKYDVKLPTGENVQGFYMIRQGGHDWRRKMLKTNGSTDFAALSDKNRTLVFKYKDDSKDNTNASDSQDYVPKFAESVHELNSRYKVGQTEIENSLFASTHFRYLDSSIAVTDSVLIPFLLTYSMDDPPASISKTYDFAPRLVDKIGLSDKEFHFGFHGNTRLIPLVDNSELGYETLVPLFYEKELRILKTGFRHRAKFKLDTLDIYNDVELFRSLKYFGFNGMKAGILQSISFDLNNQDIVEAELITY